jgi:predicted CXXCH cytochrome family protein
VAATPSQPLITDAWVSNVNQVSVSWQASTDAGGHGLTYDVYRLRQPITAANLGLAALVGSTTGTSIEVAADVLGGEVAESYVWWYAVRAKETDTPAVVSAVSKTMAPNLHGYRNATTAITCTRCHQVHGAYPSTWDYTYKELCYSCHASSAGVSPETDLGDKSTYNIKADFKEYAGQTKGSWHRSDKMADPAVRLECKACHSPHRAPYYYDASGNYVAGSSNRKMLRVQTGVDGAGKPTYTYYSVNDDAQNPGGGGENGAFCLACHGSSATPIGYVGDPGDYDATAGDHNSAAYESSAAHGSSILKSSDYGKAGAYPASQYPQVQCLACHDKHASAADKLIAYRGLDYQPDGVTTYGQVALCYACHSAGSSETQVAAGYSAPYAWNDRAVDQEFGRSSTHPVTSAASGRSLTCVNCHNVHVVSEGAGSAWNVARASSPSDTKDTPTTITSFCLDCHDGSVPAEVVDATTLVPYRIGFGSPAAPYFTGWDKNSFTGSGHYTATTTKALCENCHDPHGSDFTRLTAWTAPSGVAGLNAGVRANTSSTLSREENLCYQCHGNEAVVGGVQTQRAADAKDVATKASAAYGHNPATETTVHQDTESAAALGSGSRHAECEDCHNAHYTRKVGGTATQDTANTSLAGGALYGVYGSKPTYTVDPTPDTVQEETYTWIGATAYAPEELTGAGGDLEAYLCLKCHSTATEDSYPRTVTRPDSSTYAGTDQALEFNPSNFSYHNVMGQGTGMWSSFTVTPANGSVPLSITWAVPTVDVFVAGYNSNSMLTCTSCHTNEANSANQAKGPHGSSARWIIDPQYSADWKTAGLSSGSPNGMEFVGGANATTIICAKCHDLYGTASGDGSWSNSVHSRSAHMVTHNQPKYCTNCHIGIPHGWKRPRLLGYSDDPSPYRTVGGGSGNKYSYPLYRIQVNNLHVLNAGSVSWAKGHCETAPGGNTHTSGMQNYWP